MYLKDDKFKLKTKKGQYILDKNGNKQIRTKNSINNYKNMVTRELIENEIKSILQKQNKLNTSINHNFIKEYLEIFNMQRNFNKETSNSCINMENKIEKMLGTCTFEKEEKRAVKASYTFQYFKFLQKINNIKIEKDNQKRILTKEEKDKIKELAMNNTNLTYYTLRELLQLRDNEKFNMIIQGNIQDEKQNKFEEFEYYHKIMEVLNKTNQKIQY